MRVCRRIGSRSVREVHEGWIGEEEELLQRVYAGRPRVVTFCAQQYRKRHVFERHVGPIERVALPVDGHAVDPAKGMEPDRLVRGERVFGQAQRRHRKELDTARAYDEDAVMRKHRLEASVVL